MHPTDYIFRPYDNNQDFFTSIASKIMSPYLKWLENGIKIFLLQFNLQRPSIYDLKTDDSDPSFLSFSQKASHPTTISFLQRIPMVQTEHKAEHKPLLSNIRHLFETLLKNFPQYSKILLFVI